MIGQQTDEQYPMAKMKDFARVRDERQLAVLDIQRRYPLPGGE